MARPVKKGLSYFNLDCVQDESVRYVEALHGLEGFAVLVKVWAKIYQFEGYYCRWNEKIKMMWAREFSIDPGKLEAIIETCLNENLFDKDKAKEHGILTSRGIQNRYDKICRDAKRKGIEIEADFSLLVSSPINPEETPNKPPNKGGINPEETTQRKEEEIKEENISIEAITKILLQDQIWLDAFRMKKPHIKVAVEAENYASHCVEKNKDYRKEPRKYRAGFTRWCNNVRPKQDDAGGFEFKWKPKGQPDY